jgi:hypothetical protein
MAVEVSTALHAPSVAARMAEAAARFLATLDEPRLKVACMPFETHERFRWNYRPDGFDWDGRTFWHEGLRLMNMTREQQAAALALLDAALSLDGSRTARRIMQLEEDLRETERHTRFVHHVIRDPELYAFAIFGQPGGSDPWSWRAGGHHIGLHFTVVGGELVAPTPLFFGCNPAEVRHGPNVGWRTLPREEDQARSLITSLAADRRGAALVSETAPADILTDAYRTASPAVPPRGLRFAAMSGEERRQLVDLIHLYVDRSAPEVAEGQWRRIEAAGLDAISFAWLGSLEPNRGHYYAISGPTFTIEYDNTQDGANHIHSVFRDFTNDWGEDLLARHYLEAHR